MRATGVGVAGALIGVTIRVLIPSAEPIDLVLTGLLGAAVATTVWHVTRTASQPFGRKNLTRA